MPLRRSRDQISRWSSHFRRSGLFCRSCWRGAYGVRPAPGRVSWRVWMSGISPCWSWEVPLEMPTTRSARCDRTGCPPGSRGFALVGGVGAAVEAPFRVDVHGVDDHPRHIQHIRDCRLFQHRPPEPAPADVRIVGRRCASTSRAGTRPQMPPSAPGRQHAGDHGEHGLAVQVCRPAALRPHPSYRQQRLHRIPQAVRSGPASRRPIGDAAAETEPPLLANQPRRKICAGKY